MEFRSPTAAAEVKAEKLKYLTKNLSDPIKGNEEFERLTKELGNAIEGYADWHPILTIPRDRLRKGSDGDLFQLYKGLDHVVMFVKGFVSCPYSEEAANSLLEQVRELPGLYAYRLELPLYHDKAYPVVVEAARISFEADGTIRSRDAIAWCVQELARNAREAQVAETWWNIKSSILGQPHGSRSSLLVNQFTGGHMRKILEALNNSGMFGPVKEWSLEMLSKGSPQNSEKIVR